MEVKETKVVHKGSCHCGEIKFKIVDFTSNLIVWICNCSICYMKQNHHFIVPKSNMIIESGNESIVVYKFNTMKASHMHCKTCGVSPFYIPRSNPDGYGVNIYCIDKSNVTNIEWKNFDGQNWEEQINKCDITELSKN